MTYLMLAIISSACVSIFMRLSERNMRSQMAMFMANYAVCSLLSIFYMEKGAGRLLGSTPRTALMFGAITGILYLVSFVCMKHNMKFNGVVLTATFMKLGVLIPTLMAIFIYHEKPGILQMLGIVLAVLAIIIIHFEKGAFRHGNKKLWLLLLLILGGLGDAMINIYDKNGAANGKDGYLLVTFVVAFAIATLGAVFSKHRACAADIFYGMLIGIPNYYSARFLLLALGSVKAVLAYPMYSVATLVLITIVGILCFKENVSWKKATALVLIGVALCLLNI